MKEFIKYLEASVKQTASDYKVTKCDYSKGKNYAYFEALKVVENLAIHNVSNWVAVKDSMPDNSDQVFVKYENGKYGINEWWESDNCWKYDFDNMIVKDWCRPPCC
jgi:hypothetical protein